MDHKSIEPVALYFLVKKSIRPIKHFFTRAPLDEKAVLDIYRRLQSSCEVLWKGRFVLDKFHMMKYVNASVSHLLDNVEEVMGGIWERLRVTTKMLQRVYGEILKVTEEDRKYAEVEGALGDFLNQWDGI